MRPIAVFIGTRPEAIKMAPVIAAQTTRLLTNEADYRQLAEAANPYGDGHAAEYILTAIDHFFT